MPYPTTGQERARPDLADTFYEFDFAMNQENLIAYEVFPVRDVTEAHGTYPRVVVKEMMKRPTEAGTKPVGYALERAPRASYAREDNKFAEAPYRTREHGLEGVVDQNESRHYRSYFDHEAFTAAFVRHQLLIEAELRVATQMFSTTTFTGAKNSTHQAGVEHPDGTSTAAKKWSDPTSTPIDDIRVARQAVYDNSGIWPDSIVMNQVAFDNVRETDQVRERIHSQGAGDRDRVKLINETQLAQIFNVQNVMVGSGTYDLNNPNQAFAAGQIWGPHCNVFKRAPGSNFRQLGIGRTLHWAIDDSMLRGYVEDYWEPQNRGHVIRVRHQMQELMMYDALGYLITDCV